MSVRRPRRLLPDAAWPNDRRAIRIVLPIGVDAGYHVASAGRPMATDPGRVRRLLESGVFERRHGRRGAPLLGRFDRSKGDHSDTSVAISAAATIPHHRLFGSGVPRRAGIVMEPGPATPLRTTLPAGGVRQPLPAPVHPSRRQL